jgi:acetyl-CoA synthetase
VAIRSENEAGETREVTYAELRRLTDGVAVELRRHGVGVGDVVGMFMPMAAEAVATLFACAKLGAICVPLFSGFGPDAMRSRLADSGARVVVTVDRTRRGGRTYDMVAVAVAATRSLANPPLILVMAHDSPDFAPSDDRVCLSSHGTYDGEPVAAVAVESEHPFLLAYTSGTSGKPKGAVLGHAGALLGIGRDAVFHVDVKPDDVLMWSTDMGWIMGPWTVISAGLRGACLALYDGLVTYPDVNRLWRVVDDLGITILGVSPSLIRGLAGAGSEPESAALTTLRILAGTGEPWNAEAWLWLFDRVGRGTAPIINISGGTEVGGALLAPLPIDPLKPCTLGGPALGMDVVIVDSNGAPVDCGVGELAVRQPWPGMTRGLWNAPDLFIESYWSRVPDVWMHGDWASQDSDGFWYLHGRSDDALNVGGRRIGPSEVEEVVLEDHAVDDAAAIALPHKIKGEAIWCFVSGAGLAQSGDWRRRLTDRVADSMGKPFRPEGIVAVPELPRTRSAKIARRVIRRIALGEEPGDLSGIANPETVDLLRDALKEFEFRQ